jgi:xylulokinase
MSNILVFDVGSSALKAVVFSPSGDILARAEASYDEGVHNHRQNPAAWWGAALAAMRKLNHPELAAIALTGTMENLIPVARDGTPLGEALLYSDPCGEPVLADFTADLDAMGAARISGNMPEPLMSAFKLAWLRKRESERFERAAFFLPGAKDFLALCLTGNAVTDPTCAATTGLMDMARRDWSDSLLSLFGIERERLPRVLPATEVIGHPTEQAAAALGLAAGLPVINGCGDGGATTVGGGADDADDVSLYIGTSGWVARIADSSVLARPASFYRLPHPLGDRIIEIAPILSAGAATAWARTALRLELDEADALAAAADAAPSELMFLPYLSGERSPFLDLEVRGAFLGLGAEHTGGALYLAVLEGVALAIAANLEAMGGARRRVSLVGGGALSAVWPQIVADILGTPILTPADPAAATAFGAFRIAHSALGLPPAPPVFSVAAEPRRARAERASRLRSRFAEATGLVRQFK